MPLSDSERVRLKETLEKERVIADSNTEPANSVGSAMKKLMDREWFMTAEYEKCKFAIEKAVVAMKVGDLNEFASRFCEFSDSLSKDAQKTVDDNDDFLEKVSAARADLREFYDYVDKFMTERNVKGEFLKLSAKARAAIGELVK